MYRRNQRQFCFGDSLHLWIVLNQFVGFWPYRKTARSFVKSKYHLFATAKCFVIFAFLFNSFNALLQRNIERTNYFTGVLTGISSTQILSWVILSACHNDQLLRLFYSFDKFDWAFHKLSGSIPSKKFYEFGRVKLLLAILVTDSLCFFILMIYDTNSKILKSIIIAILRFGFLLSHFSFVILYFHIVESSKLRFVALKTIWHEFIVTKIHRPFLHSHLSAKVAEIISLYNQLLSIVDSINVCLGTRLALLYFSMFYNACMYFYLICNGKRVSTVIFLGYPLATIIHVTLTTQNMISSVGKMIDE